MEILNVTAEWSNWGILGFFMAIIGFALCAALIEDCHIIGGIITGTICICGIILIIFSATLWKTTQYEVYIKDDNAYEYIMENYEFVEQRGKIWVIKEEQ